jgi:hypothetical protein
VSQAPGKAAPAAAHVRPLQGAFALSEPLHALLCCVLSRRSCRLPRLCPAAAHVGLRRCCSRSCVSACFAPLLFPRRLLRLRPAIDLCRGMLFQAELLRALTFAVLSSPCRPPRPRPAAAAAAAAPSTASCSAAAAALQPSTSTAWPTHCSASSSRVRQLPAYTAAAAAAACRLVGGVSAVGSSWFGWIC